MHNILSQRYKYAFKKIQSQNIYFVMLLKVNRMSQQNINWLSTLFFCYEYTKSKFFFFDNVNFIHKKIMQKKPNENFKLILYNHPFI